MISLMLPVHYPKLNPYVQPANRWVLASTPGVSCVLVGMRRPAYVVDAMGILGWEPLQDPLEAYRRLPSAQR